MPRSKRLFYTLCPAVLAATLYPLTAGAQPAPATRPAPAAAAVPATQPSAPGSTPATQGFIEIRTPSTSRRATTQLTMNFKDASIDAVLEYLSEAAGFVIIKETPVEGRVNILSSQPVSSEEALGLLNSVISKNGYTTIRHGRNLTVMTIENAKKSNIPVMFGADYKEVAETNDYITQVIPVQKVDAVKLKQDLQPLIGTGADLTANAASNTVVITDKSINVRRVVQIVASMDKNDPTVVDIKVVQLKYADATSLATLITNVFKADDSQNSQNNGRNNPFQQIMQARFGGGPGGGGGGGGGRGAGGGGGGGADESGAKAAKIVAAADARTNTIVITGPAETLKVIDSVIKQLDSDPTSNQTIFTYNLKNGQATTLEPVLNSLFGNNSSGSSTGARRTSGNTTSSGSFGSNSSGGGLGGGGGRTGTGGGASRGGGSSAFGSGGTGNSAFGGGSTGGTGFGGGGTFGGGGGGLSSANQRGASELAGQVFVVANPDTNSLLVTATTKYVDQVRRIIEELDRPVPQVLIKVLLAEVSHDNSQDLGVDFSVLNKSSTGTGVNATSVLGTAAAASSGGLVVSLVERDLTATLRAIATSGKLDVLSRPYILASDNQPASITVGQEVPFITDTRTDALGQQINTIQYQDIGIILNVTPHINPEGLVIMDVAPEISQLTGTTVPISSNVSAPVFAKRSASSRVSIMDGQTIVIGGLMEDRKTSTLTKVPFLGDIPGLGLLFQRRQVTKNKTELLIFITPHVAQQPTLLQTMSQDEMKGTKLTPNAVEPGTFDDHLRGMQRGTTRPSNDPLPPPLNDPQPLRNDGRR